MKLKNTIDKLEDWINVIHKSIYIVAAIEVVIVIIIGIASSNIYHEDHSPFWVSILIFLSIIFLSITILKIAYNKTFPISIVEELKSKRKLDVAENSLKRKNAINSYISNTINDLSRCEYRIKETDALNHWQNDSDNDLTNNMMSLTRTFNNSLNTLLNSSNVKFSTGIYLRNLNAIDNKNDLVNNSGTFLLRDDYKLKETGLVRDIMDRDNSGTELEIHDAIKKSLNNGQYFEKRFQNEKTKEILMICSNIYDLKNKDSQEGVFFIITNSIKKLPEDLESVLRIFSNIISHWLDLYEHERKDLHLSRILATMNDEDSREDINNDEQESDKEVVINNDFNRNSAN